MSLNSAPSALDKQQDAPESQVQQEKVEVVVQDAIANGGCIDCGSLISLDMPAGYVTGKVIGTNGGTSLFMHGGQFYMTGSPSVVKKLKEAGYKESTSLGVPTEKIANALPYVKNFMKNNGEKFMQEQNAEDEKYRV